jgi:hypothetical protein
MKFLTKVASVLAVSVAVVGTAAADLPAGVGLAFTDIQTDGLALIDLAWPVLTAITVGFVIIKVFKKVVGRAV